MPRGRPSVYLWLGIAFGSLLLALALTGLSIRYEAARVHHQTQEIMRNGVPSLVAATRLRDLLGAFPLAAAEKDSYERQRFERASRAFEAALRKQENVGSFFPGERAELSGIRERFERFKAVNPPGRKKDAQTETAFKAQIEDIRAACERFERINQQGLQAAQAALFDVAARENMVLLIGLSAAGGIALVWWLALSRAIARPLATMRREITDFAGTSAPVFAPPPWHTPHEIDELRRELVDSASRVREASLALIDTNASLDRQIERKTAELAEANRKLALTIADLREQARAKSSFLAAVSHELRTPLSIIKGGALTLQELGERLGNPTRRELLGNIAAEAEHLALLVDDLLDAASMEAGAFRVVKEAGVDPLPLVEGVLAAMATLFEEQEIRLVRELAPELPAVDADADRLRQVLRNVLENAVKFSPAGSTVRLQVAGEGAGGERRLAFRVSDEGPGIPPELREALFEPFVRGEGHHGGTGLGLSIARQLLRAHGGDIQASAAPAGGAVLSFWLPAGSS